MSLEHARVLVTGATGGIGAAVCRALAEAGASLLISSRDGAKLAQLARTLPQARILAAQTADMEDAVALENLAAVARDLGVDTIINACGINELALLSEQSPNSVERMIRINLTAPIQLTRALLPHLQQLPAAMVVNVGSAFGSIGFPGYVSYCASKFGLRGFSEALRRELADTDISVVHVAPRATATTMNSSAVMAMNKALGNRVDEPDLVAAKIVRAMRQHARFTVIGWPEKFFASLNQILPGIVDHALIRQLPVVRRYTTYTGP